MKWSYKINQKLLFAFILTFIMIVILGTAYFNKQNVEDMAQNTNSMYNDRLVPATDFFHIAENLYQKRYELEEFVNAEKDHNNKDQTIFQKQQNEHIDALLNKFEQTYLVENEVHLLAAFKKSLSQYKKVESEILKTEKTELRKTIFYEKGLPHFDDMIDELGALNDVQFLVGSELASACTHEAASNQLLSYVQVILVFILGVLAQGLLYAYKTIHPKAPQNFRLN